MDLILVCLNLWSRLSFFNSWNSKRHYSLEYRIVEIDFRN